MTYRPDSKDRKVIYLLAKLAELGLDVREDALHRLVYRIQRKGAKIGFEFEVASSDGSVFSHELAERLERLSEAGYVKRFMVTGRSYEELYSYVYRVSEKGAALVRKAGVAQRDRRVIEEVVKRIGDRLSKLRGGGGG